MTSAAVLQSGERNIPVSKSPWLVLRTKVKCEKFVRDRLQQMGLEAYVPLKKRTARYQRKVKVYELPLITSYTFVRLDPGRRNEVLALPYVQGVLRMDGKDSTVSEKEMEWLQRICGTDIDVRAEMQSLRSGDKVIIARGQLAGMEGIVSDRRSKHEMAVLLDSLGLQLVIGVDPAMLEKI